MLKTNKQLQLMLRMISDEAENLYTYRNEFDIEEFKTRFYLLIDKLSFLQGFVENSTPLMNEYMAIYDRCEEIFNETIFSLERPVCFEKLTEDKSLSAFKNYLEDLQGLDTKMYLSDTAEEISGVFMHGILAEETMRHLENALTHYATTLSNDEKKKILEELILPKGKNQNERLSTFEYLLLKSFV